MGGSFAAELSDHYRIEREIGRGGNAIVYRAYDVKHDRLVALKVLLPELAVSVRKERFLREIQIAAKLTHPHILPLYDSGEADGTLYYVMPLVEGDSLVERIRREKQLPLDDALRITRDAASALDYAHRQGVVHRDIKPANILFVDGQAVVADFGIARALSQAADGDITHSGLALGTPHYMSPEQASGGEVDGRSDIYSLGCVLYEMLCGHPPYTGASAQEILSRHALDTLPTLSAARPNLPDFVDVALQKALAKSPADRFATAGDFAHALSATTPVPTPGPPSLGEGAASAETPGRRVSRRTVALSIVIVAALALVTIAITRPNASLRAARTARSVAVLPINVSSNPDEEYFSDGMTEELITTLSRIPHMRVPDASSSFHFKKRDLPLRVIGDSLNVASILEISTRRSGNRLRVTVDLISAADGNRLWNQKYEKQLTNVADVLTIQEEIANSVADKLALSELTESGRGGQTNRLDAYDLYLKGRYFWTRRGRENQRKAIAYFKQAIATDPHYALAYSGLADAEVLLGDADPQASSDLYKKAEAAALEALRLDETLGQAHCSLARVVMMSWQWDRAETEFRRCIQLDPNYSTAHGWYALFLVRRGRANEALTESQRAVQLDPFAPNNFNDLGAALNRLGRHQEAVAALERAVALSDGSYETNLALAYIEVGRFVDARKTIDTLLRKATTPAQRNGALSNLGIFYARSGDRAAALKILEQLKHTPGVAPLVLARLYAVLGDKENTIRILQQVVQDHDVTLAGLKVNSVWDPFRSDPRFQRLVQIFDAGGKMPVAPVERTPARTTPDG
jgi:serine/threonine protein kinase/Flp pilus assembly protein TadD